MYPIYMESIFLFGGQCMALRASDYEYCISCLVSKFGHLQTKERGHKMCKNVRTSFILLGITPI